MYKALCWILIGLISTGLTPIEVQAQSEDSKIILEALINIDESPSQIADKFIFIDFWATWCKPCIQTHPLLENLYLNFKDRVTVIGISNETESLLESFIQKHDVKFPIARDYKGLTHKKYKIQTIPASFLLDPAGNIIWSGHPADMTNQKLSKLIASNMNKNPKPDKIWIAPQKKKFHSTKNTYSTPIFLNTRKTITVQRTEENKKFELITNERSIIIEGPVHEIWSYLMCVQKHAYQYSNPNWNKSLRIEISEFDIKEDDLKELAGLLLEHLELKFSLIKKHHHIYELKSSDSSKLWSPEVFEYSEFPHFSSFMQGEDFFEGDNMSTQRLSFHLSKTFDVPIMDLSSSKTIHDWSLELSTMDALSTQLHNEYGVKLSKTRSEFTVYKLL